MYSNHLRFFLFGVILSFVVCASGMQVSVETNDNIVFSLDESLARQSKMLSNMIDDLDKGISDTIALPAIRSVEFSMIKTLLELLDNAQTSDFSSKVDIVFNFLNNQKFSVETTLAILKSANFLDCPAVLEGCAKKLAYLIIDQFRNKTIEAMFTWVETVFDIPNELSVLIGNHIAQRYGLISECEIPKNIQDALKGKAIQYSAFSADKTLLAVALNDIKVWNIKEGIVVVSLPSRSTVKSLCFSPDNRALAVASDDTIIGIWNLHTGKRSSFLNATEGLLSVDFSLDGSYLVSTSHKGNKWIVQKWNLELHDHTSYRSNSAGPAMFNEHGEIVRDTKPSYSPIMRDWCLTHQTLNHEIRSLPIEGIILVRWALELIGHGEKINFTNKRAVQEKYMSLINDKQALHELIQNYVVVPPAKSSCAIS